MQNDVKSVNYWIRVKPSSDVFGKIKQFGLIVTKLVKGVSQKCVFIL